MYLGHRDNKHYSCRKFSVADPDPGVLVGSGSGFQIWSNPVIITVQNCFFEDRIRYFLEGRIPNPCKEVHVYSLYNESLMNKTSWTYSMIWLYRLICSIQLVNHNYSWPFFKYIVCPWSLVPFYVVYSQYKMDKTSLACFNF